MGGANVAASKVVTSQIAAWLASYRFGSASYNLYLMFVRDAHALAVLGVNEVGGLQVSSGK